MLATSALLLAPALLAPVAPAASQVWVVDPAGPLQQISTAVQLAADGDVILVRPGTYGGFDVVGKSLTIVGEPGVLVWHIVFGPFGAGDRPVDVRDLTASQSLVVRGIEFRLQDIEPIPAGSIVNCAGSVAFEDCSFLSSSGPGFLVESSATVSLTRCTVSSAGPFQPAASPSYDLNPGLRVAGSNVHLFESVIVGCHGKNWTLGNSTTSDGGPGIEMLSGFVLAQGCFVAGGEGGGSLPGLAVPVCVPLGDGGPGLVVDQVGGASRVVVFDTAIHGGAGAQPAPGCTETPGVAGPDRIVVAGQVQDLGLERRAFGWSSRVREGDPIDVVVAGEPGDQALLVVSVGAGYGFYFEPLFIAPHVDLATYVVVSPGTVPPSGTLATEFLAPLLAPGVLARALVAQALFVDPLGGVFLSGPSHLVIVDASL